MLKEREEKDAKKDQLIENLQAQLEYLKNKLFGSTSEIRRDLFPGQMNLFDTMESDEKPAETIEPEELIPVKAHTKKRKSSSDMPSNRSIRKQSRSIRNINTWNMLLRSC